jgi:hypothetical protein
MREGVVRRLKFFFGLALVLLMSSAAWATPFLSVDIEATSGSTTQSGFTSWGVAAAGASNLGALSKTFSGIGAGDVDDGTFSATISAFTTSSNSTVAASTFGERNRSAPTYTGVTNANMLADLVFDASTTAQGRDFMTLALTGLTASKSYNITVFSYDNNGSSATNWTTIAPPSTSKGYAGTNTFVAHTNISNSSGNTMPTTNNGGSSPTNTNDPSGGATFSVTTDGSGNVTLYAWGGNGVDGNTGNSGINPYINGFTIESAVPEPATFVLMALGGALLLVRKRKTKTDQRCGTALAMIH